MTAIGGNSKTRAKVDLSRLSLGRVPLILMYHGVADVAEEHAEVLNALPQQGVAAINADYARHADAARKLAEEVFGTGRVLPPLLDAALN